MANILPGDNVNEFLMPKWGVLGSFGDILFSCSSLAVRTFDDLRYNAKARFASHELINQPPLLEFLGQGSHDVSFKMILVRRLGVNPTKEFNRLLKICDEGSAHFLVINNEVKGSFVIDSLSISAQIFDGLGRCLAAEVEVKLKQYAGVFRDSNYLIWG